MLSYISGLVMTYNFMIHVFIIFWIEMILGFLDFFTAQCVTHNVLNMSRPFV